MELEPRKCTECPTVFTPVHSKHLTCCEDCSDARKDRIRYERRVKAEEDAKAFCDKRREAALAKIQTRICPDCKREFKTNCSRKERCTPCAEERNRVRARRGSAGINLSKEPFHRAKADQKPRRPRCSKLLGQMESEWHRPPTCVTPCEAETCDCCGSVIQPWMERVTVGAFTYKRGHQP